MSNKTTVVLSRKDLSFETSELNGFNVMFRFEVQRDNKIAGCPMGRGRTVEAAMADLKRRTEIESPVTIVYED